MEREDVEDVAWVEEYGFKKHHLKQKENSKQ